MKINEKNPPRVFYPAKDKSFAVKECAEINLEVNEQVTFVTPSGRKHDVAAKEWGFYATQSANSRLKNEGFKTALVRNAVGRYYVMIVEKDKTDEFFDYLSKDNQKVVQWLDEEDLVE